MFTMPMAVFFGVKQILTENFELGPPMNQLGAAISAVAVVNIIIFAYIRKAFREERQSVNNKKTD